MSVPRGRRSFHTVRNTVCFEMTRVAFSGRFAIGWRVTKRHRLRGADGCAARRLPRRGGPKEGLGVGPAAKDAPPADVTEPLSWNGPVLPQLPIPHGNMEALTRDIRPVSRFCSAQTS